MVLIPEIIGAAVFLAIILLGLRHCRHRHRHKRRPIATFDTTIE